MGAFGPLADPELIRLLQLFLLILIRVLPIVSFAPFLGGKETPAQFRIGFSALLALSLCLPVAATYDGPVDGGRFLALAVKEAFLGGTVAVLLRILFDLLSSTGALVDVARGATIANVLDPTSGEQRSLVTVFLGLALPTLFLTAGGHRVVLSAFGDGLASYPPGVLLPPGLASEELVGPQAALAIGGLFVDAFQLAVRLALPVVALLFVVDVALGLLNRAVPRVQVFFLGMTLKGSLGIGVLFLVLGMVLNELLAGALRSSLSFFRF